jgi:hypothetical protein
LSAGTTKPTFFVQLTDVLTVEDCQPGPEYNEAAGERNEVVRIQQVKYAAAEREHRERANAAGALGIAMSEKIFECQPEKQTQAKKKGDAGQGRR